MKKLAILVAIVMAMSAMCVSAFAIDLNKIQIQPQIWAQNTVDWSDWTELKLADGSMHTLNLGETKTFVFSGEAWAALDSTAFQYGIQILDLSHTEAGDESVIKYELSDIVFEAEGYDTYVAPLAGVYEGNLKSYVPDWGGLADNSHVPGSYNFADVTATDGASLMAYWDALTSVTVTITFLEYNGETAEAPAEEAPAEEEAPAVEEAPAEEETEAPAVEETTEPADTGLALAVVPMLVAAVAVVASKRR